MSVLEKNDKPELEKSLAEWHLRQSGALPETCAEKVTRVCLECGTIVADLGVWQSCGRRCEACEGTEFHDECVRCRGACLDLRHGHRRSCVSVAVFRETGRVAFPEKVGGPPVPTAGKPADWLDQLVPTGSPPDDAWGRAGWYLGTIVGTAAGICRRWLDRMGIS